MSKIARWLHNAKIRVKITFGFLLVALIAGFIGVIGIVSLNIVSGSYHLAYSESVAALQHMERISASFQEVRAGLFELLLIEDRAGKQTRVDGLEGLRTVINENLTGYKTLLAQYEAEETEQQLFADLEAAIVAYGDQRREFMNGIAMDPARRGEALRFLGDGGTLHTLTLDLENAISSLVAYHQSHAQQRIHDNSALALRNELIIVAGILVGMLLAVWIGLYIARGISRPIGQIVAVTDKLALGDVDVHIDIRSEDEVGQLAKSFGYMIENIRHQAFAVERIADGDLTVSVAVRSENDLLNQKLREMVAKNNHVLTSIVAAAEQVGIGAEQVSGGAQALAAGSTEQAASVEELSASIERIAQQAQENADIVNISAGLLDAVDAEINEGNTHMGALTAAMAEIGAASGQIANITKVIEDIAFQTNILALNAAIEAARAGAAGKGFAVVADEVRSLAAKSAEAAKQTGTLIGASVATVDKGAQMTAQTVEILRGIGVKSAQVTESFGRIEQSSAEQAGAIAQIRDGLSQVSSVIQTNAATAEENSATSEEMSAQAATLRHEVGTFKLAGAADAPSPARPYSQQKNAAPSSNPAYAGGKY